MLICTISNKVELHYLLSNIVKMHDFRLQSINLNCLQYLLQYYRCQTEKREMNTSIILLGSIDYRISLNAMSNVKESSCVFTIILHTASCQ